MEILVLYYGFLNGRDCPSIFDFVVVVFWLYFVLIFVISVFYIFSVLVY